LQATDNDLGGECSAADGPLLIGTKAGLRTIAGLADDALVEALGVLQEALPGGAS
jgi:hypothetical protein